MSYWLYKNCSRSEFDAIRERLNALNRSILSLFGARLKREQSAKEVDYLVLNYGVIENGPYQGNLAIMFLDEPGEPRFDIGILKALDIGRIRFYIRERPGKGIPLYSLEKSIEKYLETALAIYDLWDTEDVKNGEQTTLTGDG
jgi:hypothetical protein